jgi:peptide/nickel transport system substrate-binding protein
LRKDVHFHDGTRLDAEIMADNLRRLQQEGSLLDSVPIKSIEGSGKDKVIIQTEKPFAPLPAYLAKGEAGALAPSSFNDQGEVIRPVGTGPFEFESWEARQRMTLRANPDYWGEDKAHVDKVVYKAVPNAITRRSMLEAGELHIAQILPPESIRILSKNDHINIQQKNIGRCRIAAFNSAKEPFSDPKIRRAVNYALNRSDLVEYVLEGVGGKAGPLFPPEIFWANAELEGYTYDPDKARRLLEEAGWKDTNGDGVREKNGEILSFKIITYPERAALPPTAEVVQSQLAELGMDTELEVLQVDACKNTRDSGDFGMFILGRGLFFVPDPDYNLTLDYYSENTVKPGWGAYHYQNPTVDRLLDQGRATFDRQKRKDIYDRVQEVLLRDAPMAYLNYYTNVDGVRDEVAGYVMHPIEHCFHLENVRLLEN